MKEIMQGKVKTLYDTDDAQKVLIKYEDKVTAFDGKMVDLEGGSWTIQVPRRKNKK